MREAQFWHALDRLISAHEIIIDRPRGSVHPRYKDLPYPLDYGYLQDTVSGDGRGIDVWLGTSGARVLTGILCTVDPLKKDAEIKLLIGCGQEEVEIIACFHDRMGILYITRHMED